MKSLANNPVLFLILFALFLLGREHLCLISLCLCLLFWYLRTKDYSILLAAGIFLLALIPLYTTKYPEIEKGTAVTVKSSYAVIATGNQRVLVYTDGPLELDGEYTLSGPYTKITGSKGFFCFDVENWAHSMGAYYSTDAADCTLIKENFSLRHALQEKIETVADENQKAFLYRILLNINTQEENNSFLYEHGFTCAGMLAVWNLALKYFVSSKKRKWILLCINIFLIILYHAPMLLVQSLLFRMCSRMKLTSAQRTCLCLSLILVLYPGILLTLSFLIPACYRLSFLFEQDTKKSIFFLILCFQSIFLHHINLLEILLYPCNLVAVGLLWVMGMLSLWIRWIPFLFICNLIDHLNALILAGNVNGCMLGLGLIPFLLLCSCFLRKKYRIEVCTFFLLFFQFTGLFHPFAEITAINVGQGDSILIREPFNRQNVLIDTGKPTQWGAVNHYLESKSIQKINTLVITHSDNDHSGNMDAVIENYHPDQVVTSYQDCIKSDQLVFYDLNTIQNNDPNESSIVLAAQINHLQYLFMADADQKVEEQIAQEYGNLHCDVLKLSHHGSKTGSCSRFLDTVRPRLGLISSGAYAIYHHPSPETIQQMLKRHIDYFDTKDSGDISIIALPGFNLLITAGWNVGIIM